MRSTPDLRAPHRSGETPPPVGARPIGSQAHGVRPSTYPSSVNPRRSASTHDAPQGEAPSRVGRSERSCLAAAPRHRAARRGHRPPRSAGSGGDPCQDDKAGQSSEASASRSSSGRAMRAPQSHAIQTTEPSTPASSSPHRRWSVKKATQIVQESHARECSAGWAGRRDETLMPTIDKCLASA
jgi:hypothetical protein